MDNGSKKTKAWLATRSRFSIHHTPEHASRLNQVELLFSTLTRRLLRRGQFASHDELAAAIDTFVLAYDEHDGQALPLDLRRQPTSSRMYPRRINAALH
ncbi:hypothetical protein ACH4NT_14535 [Streptomyces lydicus]|uniref:hypothetical protein n=1 Tax=Streptomyces lydicus TaxID=47763 RepID=UPI00379012AA